MMKLLKFKLTLIYCIPCCSRCSFCYCRLSTSWSWFSWRRAVVHGQLVVVSVFSFTLLSLVVVRGQFCTVCTLYRVRKWITYADEVCKKMCFGFWRLEKIKIKWEERTIKSIIDSGFWIVKLWVISYCIVLWIFHDHNV